MISEILYWLLGGLIGLPLVIFGHNFVAESEAMMREVPLPEPRLTFRKLFCGPSLREIAIMLGIVLGGCASFGIGLVIAFITCMIRFVYAMNILGNHVDKFMGGIFSRFDWDKPRWNICRKPEK